MSENIIQVSDATFEQEVLKSPMESGVAAGYNRLEEILATLPGHAK